MRRITALALAALMLLILGAAAAETDPALFVAEQLQTLMDKDGKWYPHMLKDAAISQTAVEGGWEVTVTYIDPAAGEGAALSDALASLTAPPTEQVTVDVVEKDGALAFGKKRNLRTVDSAVKKTAAAAKKTYEAKDFRTVIGNALLPENGAGSALAAALGYDPQSSAGRIALLGAMTEILGVDASDGPDAVKVTVRVHNWETLLVKADKAARERLKQTTGACSMSTEEIEAVFCEEAMLLVPKYAESNKGAVKFRAACSLRGAADGTLTASDPLVSKLAPYLNQLEDTVGDLKSYAGTLSFYPAIVQPDTGFFAGGGEDGGTLTAFRNADPAKSSYIRVSRGGTELFRGFVYTGDRLYAGLTPGTYDVLMASGAAWYGEAYLFGEDTACCRFSLDIPAGEAALVTLGSGDILTEPAAETEVAVKP